MKVATILEIVFPAVIELVKLAEEAKKEKTWEIT